MNDPCIILRSVSPNRLQVPRALTANEWEAYQNANRVLLDFESVDNLFSLVYFNANRVVDTHLHWFKEYNSRKSLMDGPDLTSVRLDINRTLLNFLSMAKTFIDHVETHLKKKYGETSLEFEKFKKAQNTAYDNSCSYRIMYQLRNYAQHCGLPVQTISFSTNSTQLYGTSYVDRFAALCVRDQLLENFNWKKVRADIEAQESKFDVMPHVFEYMNNLFDIYLVLAQVDNKLIESAQFVKQLIEGIAREGFIPCIGELISRSEGDEELQYSMQDMPLAIAEHILAASEKQAIPLSGG